MEHYLGKDRILELYLNYAQWGKNIFGCEAAARQYYKKSSFCLTRSESARLAAVLAMPTRVSPTNYQSSFIAKRIAVIANNLYLHHTIDDSGFLSLTGILPPKKETDSIDVTDSTLSKPLESVKLSKPLESV
jgi:monofunctional biosynthetic peptidoglycan transglycosylase